MELKLLGAIQSVSLHGRIFLIVGIAIIAIASLLWWSHDRSNPKIKIKRAIKQLGRKYLSGVRIADGMDGYLVLDYLVLTEQGVILVGIKSFDGAIYGSEDLPQWRQVTQKGSFEFPNPLKELDLKAKALHTLLPELQISGLLIFSGRSQFPKKMPVNVKHISDLDFMRTAFKITPEVKSRWNTLKKIAEQK